MFNLLSADGKQAKGTELNSEPLWEERVPKNVRNSDVTSLCFLRKNGGIFQLFGGIYLVWKLCAAVSYLSQLLQTSFIQHFDTKVLPNVSHNSCLL